MRDPPDQPPDAFQPLRAQHLIFQRLAFSDIGQHADENPGALGLLAD